MIQVFMLNSAWPKICFFGQEIRNPKHETRNNGQNANVLMIKTLYIQRVKFKSFHHLIFEFVSDFDIRIWPEMAFRSGTN